MKKLFVLLLMLTMIFACAYAEDEFVSVADGADMISPAVEKYVLLQNRILSEETGARIIFATAEDTGELSTIEYARKMYEEMNVAAIGRKNCVFVFLNENARDYNVIVSSGISGALTDVYAQECLVQYMEEDFDKGDYDASVVKTFNAFGNWYMEKYGVKLKLTENMTGYNDIINNEKKEKELKIILIVVIGVSVATIIIWCIVYLRRKNRMEKLRKKRQERRKRYMQIKTKTY